jgi:predicted NACHT family NTPase
MAIGFWGKIYDSVTNFAAEFGVTSQNAGQWTKAVVLAAQGRYEEKLAKRYDRIRLLGRDKDIPLEGIFTGVNLLEERAATRLYDVRGRLDEQQRELSEWQEIWDRRSKLRDGLEVVKEENFRRLFVVGKPGAGKTTYLRYLALEAARGRLAKVPILIELYEWGETGADLLSFMVRQFDICGLPDARLWIEMLLKRGQALVLFDGLDEVKQKGGRQKRLITEIRDFCDKYDSAQCVVTCRVAATDYSFTGCQYVEIADFNDAQIREFVGAPQPCRRYRPRQSRRLPAVATGQEKTNALKVMRDNTNSK